MKKFNMNIPVFIIAALFIIYGFAGHVFDLNATISRLYERKEELLETHDVKKTLDQLSNGDLWYHDSMVDLNSLRLNLLNITVVQKGDDTFVKTAGGDLSDYQAENTAEETAESVRGINYIYQTADAADCEFLFVAVPKKPQYEQFPAFITDHSAANHSDLIAALYKNGIPYLDCETALKASRIDEEDIFFHTDHHWRPYSGFVVSGAVCEKLNELYSFPYEERYTDIENYNIETYEKSFLGSQEKKIGKFFTKYDSDNFDLITPKFDTDFTETLPYENSVRNGDFSETLLHKENLFTSFYHGDRYSTYSGGNRRLQIIENHLENNGKKILIFRNSYACVVTPYLALQVDEMHLIDNREMSHIDGPLVDVASYIDEIKPDYVIVIE